MRKHGAIFVFIACLAASAAAQSIRNVDFMNFTYEVDYCSEDEDKNTITVRDGKFYRETVVGEVPERMYYSINVDAFGDLDGDGKEEAVITSICNTGGTGNFSEAYIFAIHDGKVKRLITIVGGDRAYGGIRTARIENGLLQIDSNDAGETGGACCPEFVVTNTYRLEGEALTEAGIETRRELYPATPVKFSRGKYSNTFRVGFGKDDQIRRFSVSAAKGQTLSVTKTNRESHIRLLKGDANVVSEGEALVAKLKAKGEYVFEISSYDDKEVEFFVTVSIK